MINLTNIHFGYSKKRMLFSELNLSLTSGHIYGLLGKNGAGKTSLLKIISGLLFAQKGNAIVMDKRAELRNPEILKELYFLPEEMYIPHLKIRNYAKVYAPFYPGFSMEQFNHYLEEFEINDQEHFADKLSHGQQKKLLISFALATNTRILLLDEPTNGLDIPSKSIFRRVMASSTNDDRLVIISTHQVRDLHSLIDSVIILDNGEIIFNQPSDRITEKLVFKVEESNVDLNTVLYSEDNIRGILVVKENTEQIESKLDIELLFNAIIANKKRIKEIFES